MHCDALCTFVCHDVVEVRMFNAVVPVNSLHFIHNSDPFTEVYKL